MFRHVGWFVLAVTVLAFAPARPAAAVLQFYTGFVEGHIKEHPDKEYVEHVTKQAKCFICHQGRKAKTNRNAFGQELAKLLDRKTDARDKEKIAAALNEVLKMHVDPKDEKSETYGDRIKAGKLPFGVLADLQKEPAEPTEAVK